METSLDDLWYRILRSDLTVQELENLRYNLTRLINAQRKGILEELVGKTVWVRTRDKDGDTNEDLAKVVSHGPKNVRVQVVGHEWWATMMVTPEHCRVATDAEIAAWDPESFMNRVGPSLDEAGAGSLVRDPLMRALAAGDYEAVNKMAAEDATLHPEDYADIKSEEDA